MFDGSHDDFDIVFHLSANMFEGMKRIGIGVRYLQACVYSAHAFAFSESLPTRSPDASGLKRLPPVTDLGANSSHHVVQQSCKICARRMYTLSPNRRIHIVTWVRVRRASPCYHWALICRVLPRTASFDHVHCLDGACTGLSKNSFL